MLLLLLLLVLVIVLVLVLVLLLALVLAILLLLLLLLLLVRSPSCEVRTHLTVIVSTQAYAPVLLRRVCFAKEWQLLSTQTHTIILRGLLQALTLRTLSVKTKRLLGNCVSDLSLVVLLGSEDDEDTPAGQSYTESTAGADALNKAWPGM